MGEFVKGDVVVVAFPFSDLSSSKRRPALVVAKASEDDLILAQITSQSFYDSYAVGIDANDFENGGLRISSNIRANKLFTAETGIIIYKAGSLKYEKTTEVINVIVNLLSQDK
jgi:mRNA interferase MazF